MDDLYKAPESEILVRKKYSIGNILAFKRFGTINVILLTVVTLGFYMPYWIYTRTRTLNSIIEEKIPEGFCLTTLFIWVGSFALVLIFPFLEEFNIISVSHNMALLLSGVDLVSNVLFIVWVFWFRNRLKVTFSNTNVRYGIILTFFFQIYYLQYKLNELIDQSNARSSFENAQVNS